VLEFVEWPATPKSTPPQVFGNTPSLPIPHYASPLFLSPFLNLSSFFLSLKWSVHIEPVQNQNSSQVIEPLRAVCNDLVFTYFNYTLRPAP
jgi:hypothetical protein